MPLLEVEGLKTQFTTRHGVVHAVDGVDLSLDAGETLAIVGESGCGKSATALSIMGLLPAPRGRVAAGSIRFDGRELVGLEGRALDRLRGPEIAMVFQDPLTSLNPSFTVGAQIVETLRRHLPLDKAAARKRAVELLGETRISSPERRLDAYPHQLSGGMRQRVMIALALACNPRLLIADEPTTALDVTVQADILGLLASLRDEHGMGMILITHDMGVAAETADRVAVMYAGQVVEQAPVEALFARPEHPYTEALLGALPPLDGDDVRHARLTAIPGRPPDLIDPPAACRFRDRCPHAAADDGCATAAPPLRELRPGHWVRSAHPASARQGTVVGA
ncbi:ABC transporter ATP-binding protein [Patulibacter defluvii]|uniref:ABC transporter ATP-binding protein n=1 Tax=Patulibacter defluvii TaxID=3095358 RepID=UPI002A75D4B1|nr:ABC transporter ATP-binding protein [Patulibacter sp. DM4]